MKQQLINFQSKWPLPANWSDVEIFSQNLVFGETTIYGVGLMSKNETGKISSSSATGLDENSILIRAYIELLERIALIDLNEVNISNQDWKLSLSNGVAAHTDLRLAKTSAAHELQERSQILKSWYGEFTPVTFTPAIDPLSFLKNDYEITWLNFRENIIAVLMKPKDLKRPVIFASAGSLNIDVSIAKTADEALQKILFSWDEPIALDCEMLADPISHLEYYSSIEHFDILLEWINGAREKRLKGLLQLKINQTMHDEIIYEDITPAIYEGKLFIIRARGSNYLPLVFGIGHPQVELVGHLSKIDLFHPLS